MVEQIKSLPSTVVGFRAADEVTKDDYDAIVIPAVDELVARVGEIRFLLVLETDVKNYTAGAWVNDAWVGLKNLAKWKRIAVVSHEDLVQKFSNWFSALVPGESRGFAPTELDAAKQWVAEG